MSFGGEVSGRLMAVVSELEHIQKYICGTQMSV